MLLYRKWASLLEVVLAVIAGGGGGGFENRPGGRGKGRAFARQGRGESRKTAIGCAPDKWGVDAVKGGGQ
ncbi:hypothetical protein B1F77_21600 [Pseudomonas syringae]|nr:hypothetical protein B1F77_21600 [Pseudomonas syringae]